MSLTYKDIINRQHNLITDSHILNKSCNISYVYENLSDRYSYNKAKMILENWQDLSDNENEALRKVFEVFEIVSDRDSESNIKNAASIIEGKIIPKLRNAKQTRLLNNYKRGWIKHKHTSMLNDTKDNINAVSKAKANGGYLGNSLHPRRKYKRDIYGRKIGEEKSKGNNGENNNEQQEPDVTEECFNNFINVAYINEQCDRVLNNHNNLLKRFDLESKVRKCPTTQLALQECIYSICELIESYDIPFEIKYNVALENTMYLMTKNCMPTDNKFIVESVTDYFLMNNIDDDRLNCMKYVLENSKFFSDDDLSSVMYLCIDEDALIKSIEEEDDITPIEENKIHDMFLKFKEKRTNTIKKETQTDSLKIKKIIHDFKKSHKKTIESFKDAISRIFIQRPEAIIQELPDIFEFVRLGIVIGAFSLNMFLGVITLVTGYFLKMKISREQMQKVIDKYEKERDKYKKLMEEAKANGNEKKAEKYEKLYKQYKKDLSTLEMKQDELYTDAENDKRMEEKWAKEAEAEMANGDDDFGDDFDFDFDFDFEEASAIKYTEMMSVLYEQINFTKAGLMNTIKNNIADMSNEDIYNITEAVKICNDIFDCPRYINILENELSKSRQRFNESHISSIQRNDTLKNCINEIEQVKYNTLLESVEIDDSTCPPIELYYENLKCKYDLMNDTLELLTSYKNTFNEGVFKKKEKKERDSISFMSKLKITKENLKRNAHKLKDKDKQLSMKLDSELNRFMASTKKAMISDSRENIIKGSLLPSASRCIHIALASGAAFLIHPVLAIIGVIGYIGCSKSLTEKERNLILDDIDIEIKMCDKYLRIAEEKDDLVAVREIMKTKRDLERQRSRILYNKNYVFKNKKQYDYKPDSMKDKDD